MFEAVGCKLAKGSSSLGGMVQTLNGLSTFTKISIERKIEAHRKKISKMFNIVTSGGGPKATTVA